MGNLVGELFLAGEFWGLFFSSESTYQSDTSPYGVDTRIGVIAVPVRIMCGFYPCGQMPLWGELPVQVDAGIQVSIDFRTYHIVVRVACLVILFHPNEAPKFHS